MQGFMDEEFDVIHAHSYIFASSNQAALTRLFRRTPLMLHLHGGIDASVPPGGFSDRFKIHFKKAVYDRSIGKMTMAAADVVASVSKKDLELAEEYFGVPHEKLSWIPNAVDTVDFHNGTHDVSGRGFYEDKSGLIRERYATGPRVSRENGAELPGESRTVAFIGRLEHWKGIMTFLRMAARISKMVRDVEFIAVGGGSLLAPLRESGRYEGRRIRLLGQIPHERIAGILQKCAMLVLPSYMEGLPTVCLESLASEVPVVASAVGGVSEVVINNQTGLLIQPGDVDSCTERVQFLLDDDGLRMEMGRKGRELIERYYTWNKVTDRVEDTYHGLEAT